MVSMKRQNKKGLMHCNVYYKWYILKAYRFIYKTTFIRYEEDFLKEMLLFWYTEFCNSCKSKQKFTKNTTGHLVHSEKAVQGILTLLRLVFSPIRCMRRLCFFSFVLFSSMPYGRKSRVPRIRLLI